ncbi:MAG: HU family DNA-binding protein [Vicinamibacteria bacterium]
MNKAEMIAGIAEDTGLTKADVGRCLDSLVEQVTRTLKKGDRVALVGFGTFGVSKRKARAGRNPQTGAVIRIAARRVPRFAPGKELKAAVNK